MKILIIEDELALSNSISSYLTNEHFICETAYDFDTALEKIKLFEYDCVVLDITLPKGNGLELLKELKAKSTSEGVVIISAKNAIDDKIMGLQIGADDYLTKPFHLAELSARIEAIIRRRSFEGKNLVQFVELTLNLQNKTVRLQDRFVDLTRKEFDLLLFFISNKNKVITKTAITGHLWGDGAVVSEYDNIIYTHVKNIRRKLKREGKPDYIESVYGLGYRLSLTE